MNEIKELLNLVNTFRDERDWRQFHNEKDLSVSIVLEATELLEKFQWKSSQKALEKDKAGVEEELADVLLYAFMLADNLGVDPAEIMKRKLEENSRKYPVDKSRGSSAKYTELSD